MGCSWKVDVVEGRAWDLMTIEEGNKVGEMWDMPVGGNVVSAY